MMTRIVIYHPDRGIFLGQALGLGFWSNLDSVGQTEATTFKNEDDAKDYAELTWSLENLQDIQYVPVEATAPDNGATIADIVQAGLPGWVPEGMKYDS